MYIQVELDKNLNAKLDKLLAVNGMKKGFYTQKALKQAIEEDYERIMGEDCEIAKKERNCE